MKTRYVDVQQHQLYPEPWLIGERRLARMLYRGLLGRPMDNVRWTNSTFWRSASSGEASWWLRLAGWHRSMIRISVAWMFLLSVSVSALFLVGATETALRLLVLHLAALSVPALLLDHHFRREHGVRLPMLLREQDEDEAEERYYWRVRMVTVREGRRTWEREVLEPLAAALSPLLDHDYRPGEARHWLTVPRGYLEPGGGAVEIDLPRNFSGAVEAQRRKLESTVRSKLGMLEISADWRLRGRHPQLVISAPPAPPGMALFSDYRSMLEMTREYRPFLGVVASGELLSAEMVNDSPHIALSAGSGAGKSMMMKAIIMQALRWGWGVIILDWKAESHTWAKGLPGVTYVTTTEGIHDQLVRIGEEVDIRKTQGMAGRANVLVVREEWNMTAALLSDYWQALRSTAETLEKQTMPQRSPALAGVQALDFAGRQFGMFDLLAAQRMSNRVFNGNVDVRENFMIRLMARYTMQTWKMLIPHIKYMRKPKELGRWVVAAGDEATYVQGILISDEEAREFAMGGTPGPLTPLSSSHYPGSPSAPAVTDGDVDVELGEWRRPVSTSQDMDSPQLDDKPASIILRKLSDISTALEYLGITRRMLEKASRSDSQGDRNFPPVRGGNPHGGYLYDLAEVTEWARRKRATEVAERKING